MSKASELMTKVLQKMEERNLLPYYVCGIHNKADAFTEVDDRIISIEETFRMNGINSGLENVTVTITVYKCDEKENGKWWRMTPIVRVKVPKDASDKVIASRIDKVESALNC